LIFGKKGKLSAFRPLTFAVLEQFYIIGAKLDGLLPKSIFEGEYDLTILDLITI